MILNQNGTPYEASGSMQQFDPENRDHFLFNLWDEEAIKIGGSPLMYYEVYNNYATIDKVYWEDRGKLFAPIPIQLYCYYDPAVMMNSQGLFGFDGLEEVTFELNYRSVLRTVGHPVKLGSRLYTPHKRENWVIVERKTGEYRMWGELRLTLVCARFQESVSTGEGKVTAASAQPDFKING